MCWRGVTYSRLVGPLHDEVEGVRQEGENEDSDTIIHEVAPISPQKGLNVVALLAEPPPGHRCC